MLKIPYQIQTEKVSIEQLVDAMRVRGVRSSAVLRQINSLQQVGIKHYPIKVSRSRHSHIIAFDRGRLRKAGEIEIFGLCIHRSTPICPPPLPPLKNYLGATGSFPSTLCFVSSGSRVSRFVSRVGVVACCGGI